MPLRMQTFDSNGPDVRIRGSAFQVHEKYLQLARDASSSGDRIIAESYLQHAEHYYRIIAAVQEQQAQQQGNDPNRRFRPEAAITARVSPASPTRKAAARRWTVSPATSRSRARRRAATPTGAKQEGRQQDGRQQDGRQNDGARMMGAARMAGSSRIRPIARSPRCNIAATATRIAAYRSQPAGAQSRGEGGNYRRQAEGEYRGDRDQQHRQSPDRDGEGGQRQYSEDRPRVRTLRRSPQRARQRPLRQRPSVERRACAGDPGADRVPAAGHG